MQRQAYVDRARNNSKCITRRGVVQGSQECLVGSGRVAGHRDAASVQRRGERNKKVFGVVSSSSKTSANSRFSEVKGWVQSLIHVITQDWKELSIESVIAYWENITTNFCSQMVVYE